MQNTVLDIVSTLYSANDTIINLKIIDDIEKTTAFMESKKKNLSCEFSKEEERKLFELKMSRELKYSERTTKRKASEKMKKIHYFNNAYEHGEITLEEIKQRTASWIGHAKHGNTYNLRKKVLGGLKLKGGQRKNEKEDFYFNDSLDYDI